MIIGIDPGKHGAITVLNDFKVKIIIPLDKVTPQQFPQIFAEIRTLCGGVGFGKVFMEDVHASPQMGVTSAFSFGKGFGLLLGMAYAYFPEGVTLVRPASWQAALGCMAGGDKSKLFEFAKTRYPREYSTGMFKKDQADSLLIATYGLNVQRWN